MILNTAANARRNVGPMIGRAIARLAAGGGRGARIRISGLPAPDAHTFRAMSEPLTATLTASRSEPPAVPHRLRHWFIAHFAASVLFGLPLFFFPGFCLHLFGWTEVDAALSRTVAAAMLAIGTQSMLSRSAGLEVFRALVTLNALWSVTSTIGLVYSVLVGAAPEAAGLFAAGFAIFSVVWIRYRAALRQR